MESSDLRAGLHLPKTPGVHSECACGWRSLGFDAQSHEEEYEKHLAFVLDGVNPLQQMHGNPVYHHREAHDNMTGRLVERIDGDPNRDRARRGGGHG